MSQQGAAPDQISTVVLCHSVESVTVTVWDKDGSCMTLCRRAVRWWVIRRRRRRHLTEIPPQPTADTAGQKHRQKSRTYGQVVSALMRHYWIELAIDALPKDQHSVNHSWWSSSLQPSAVHILVSIVVCYFHFATELMWASVLAFVGLDQEVHVSHGGRGRGHRADINTRRAGIHDAFTLELNWKKMTLTYVSLDGNQCMSSTVIDVWTKLRRLVRYCY